MKRKIIHIDEQKCTGCGLCANGCPESAIKIVNGKAKLTGELLCDGLGDCLGYCPEDAISIEEREAESYNEEMVIENIIPLGVNEIETHLQHLDRHNEKEYLKTALNYLAKKGITVNYTPKILNVQNVKEHQGACPGSKSFSFETKAAKETVSEISHLTHWPIQLHLISPVSSHFTESDLLLAADCIAYTFGGFHGKFLKGKTLAIGCPKLDKGLENYQEKIISLIDEAKVKTITVMVMQVPCCGGLVNLVSQAVSKAKRHVPVKRIVIGIKGEILDEEWLHLT